MSDRKPLVHFSHQPSTHLDTSVDEAWHNYSCAHCDTKVTGKVVVATQGTNALIRWLLCPNCEFGSVSSTNSDGESILPNICFGVNIDGLPKDIAAAYNEARSCYSINAFTSCELMCRKILMHVAVDKGCTEGKSFEEYIDYIELKKYITPIMKPWVDLIRKHGNSSTHKLISPDVKRSESTLMFTAELLRIVYEMEHIAKKYVPSS